MKHIPLIYKNNKSFIMTSLKRSDDVLEKSNCYVQKSGIILVKEIGSEESD